MGRPDRPVVGVIGDGSSMYAIQALWSAARYEVGVLLIVMANGGYAVMDALAREHGGDGAWPARSSRSTSPGSPRCLGCPARRVADARRSCCSTLDEVLPGLAGPSRAAAGRGGPRLAVAGAVSGATRRPVSGGGCGGAARRPVSGVAAETLAW